MTAAIAAEQRRMAEKERASVEKQACKCIKAFIRAYSTSGVDASQIRTLILAGSLLYQKLASEEPIEYIVKDLNDKGDLATREVLAGFIWFLMSKAITKKQGFKDGAFLLEDPKGRIGHFFNKIKVGCERLSSHLKTYQQSNMIKGINIYNGILPGGLYHILVQTLKSKKLIFIKPELYGVLEQYSADDGYQVVMHGFDFIISRIRKAVAAIPGVAEFAAPFLAPDDAPENRKERIPVKEVNDFLGLAAGLPGAGTAIKEVGSIDSGEGIQSMVKHIKNWLTMEENVSLTSQKKEAMRTFLIKLNEDYDHLDMRFGKEVILDQRELSSGDLLLP